MVATGRMFRSIEPYLADAGSANRSCATRAALSSTRRRASSCSTSRSTSRSRGRQSRPSPSAGSRRTCTSTTSCSSKSETEYSRAYSQFQHLPVTEVGDLLGWLERPPTKLVQVADPPVLAELRPVLERRFDGRMFVTTSLPNASARQPGSDQGLGDRVRRELLGLDLGHVVALGDGRTTSSCWNVAGFGVAIETATHVCSRSPTQSARAGGRGSRDRHRGRAGPRLLLRDRPQGSPRRARCDRGGARPQGARRVRPLLAGDARWRELVPRVDELRSRTKLKGKPTPESSGRSNASRRS